MKEELKSIYFSIIRFSKTLVSLLSVILFNKCGIDGQIKKLLLNVKEKPVSILAGGPSMKDVLTNRLELLTNNDLIVMNYFGNTDYFWELKPTYYIMLDPVLFDNNYRNPGLNEEKDASVSHPIELLINNFRKVEWEMILFLPYIRKGKNIYKRFSNNPNIKIVTFHSTRIVGFDWFQNWMYGHNQGMPSSRNVIIPAIMLMANIGYKQIYMYGCEFSWTKTMDVDPDNGMMFFNDRHFYSKSEIRYFGKGGYRWWLMTISDSLYATEQIAKYAIASGVKIVNRTKGSFIDAFDYENPDTIEKDF